MKHLINKYNVCKFTSVSLKNVQTIIQAKCDAKTMSHTLKSASCKLFLISSFWYKISYRPGISLYCNYQTKNTLNTTLKVNFIFDAEDLQQQQKRYIRIDACQAEKLYIGSSESFAVDNANSSPQKFNPKKIQFKKNFFEKFTPRSVPTETQNPKAKVRSKKCSNYFRKSGPVHAT